MYKVFAILFSVATFLVACTDTEIISIEDETPTNTDLVEGVHFDTVFSKHITLEDARKELEVFLGSNATSISKSGTTGFPSKRIAAGFVMNLGKKSLSKSNANNTDAKIYVFNFEDDGGFALMSSSRETPPIFAITEEGNLDTTKEIDNPGFAIFMANLETKLLNGELNYDADTLFQDTLTTLSKLYTPSKTIQWSVFSPYREDTYKHKNGLCPYWHQYYPFNRQCDSAGRRAYVGCVPVACGLLMAIYRHPISYKDTILHWDDMLSNIYNNDIAWLLRKLGDKENLSAIYGTIDSSDGTPAFSNYIPRTLRNFGYSNGGVYGNYNTSVVCSDLKQGYPVLISGKEYRIDSIRANGVVDTFYEGGHQWIGQGLLVRTRDEYHYIGEREYTQFVGMTTETDYYVLCNMGWRGTRCNGYYLSRVFDVADGPVFPETYSKSIKMGRDGYYQYYIKAVTGIRK